MDDGVWTGVNPVNRRGGRRDFWTVERDAKLVYVMEKYGDIHKASRVLGVAVHHIVSRCATLKRTGQYYLPKDHPRYGRMVDFDGDGGKRRRIAFLKRCHERWKAKQNV